MRRPASGKHAYAERDAKHGQEDLPRQRVDGRGCRCDGRVEQWTGPPM